MEGAREGAREGGREGGTDGRMDEGVSERARATEVGQEEDPGRGRGRTLSVCRRG